MIHVSFLFLGRNIGWQLVKECAGPENRTYDLPNTRLTALPNVLNGPAIVTVIINL